MKRLMWALLSRLLHGPVSVSEAPIEGYQDGYERGFNTGYKLGQASRDREAEA